MLHKITGCIAALNRIGVLLGGFGLLVMTGLVMTDVIMRRIFNLPIIFADEVAGYLLVLVTFIGLGYTLEEDGHIQVGIIIDRISPGKRVVLKVLWCVFGIIFTLFLFYYTWQLAWESYELKAFAPTPTQIPIFPFQIVMPFGCMLFLIQLILELVNSVVILLSSKPIETWKEE